MAEAIAFLNYSVYDAEIDGKKLEIFAYPEKSLDLKLKKEKLSQYMEDKTSLPICLKEKEGIKRNEREDLKPKETPCKVKKNKWDGRIELEASWKETGSWRVGYNASPGIEPSWEIEAECRKSLLPYLGYLKFVPEVILNMVAELGVFVGIEGELEGEYRISVSPEENQISNSAELSAELSAEIGMRRSLISCTIPELLRITISSRVNSMITDKEYLNLSTRAFKKYRSQALLKDIYGNSGNMTKPAEKLDATFVISSRSRKGISELRSVVRTMRLGNGQCRDLRKIRYSELQKVSPEEQADIIMHRLEKDEYEFDDNKCRYKISFNELTNEDGDVYLRDDLRIAASEQIIPIEGV